MLFVCSGNSARSPIAEALLRHHAGDRVTALSAGTRPKARLHPETARVLAGYGIDVAGRRPRGLDAHHGRRIDWLITLCDRAREACPELPQRPRRSHWSIPDPAAAPDPADAFARTAADIERRVRHLLPVLDPPGGPP
ncbi:MAG TPA: arsenate reductase ArsC [Egibacteraceae bacterium]